MSVTKNLVLAVVGTDVSCFEVLVWLVWPVLDEAVGRIAFGDWGFGKGGGGRSTCSFRMYIYMWTREMNCKYYRNGKESGGMEMGLKYVVWVSDYIN